MSTTPNTIQFTTHIGGGATIHQADAAVYQILTTEPAPIATATVYGPDFQLEIPPDAHAIYYIVLNIRSYLPAGSSQPVSGGVVWLLAAFKGTVTAVTVGAHSTIASAFCFARFIRLSNNGFFISCTNRQAGLAYGMKNNFFHTDGDISPVISSSPNGLESNSYPLFNFLSNTIYYSLTDASFYQQFLQLATTGAPAASFFQALMNLVHAPFTNVPQIYQLIAEREQLFSPSLPGLSLPPGSSPQPNQWTLTVKANKSGAQNFAVGGAAFVVFDKEDKAWIATNTRQGTPNSARECTVLNADASPCSFSPVSGGGILGPGFGIAIDKAKEKIAIGNFGWGPEQYNPQHGSISRFLYTGEVISSPNGDINGTSRVQGLCYDNQGNLWMASMGSQNPMAPTSSLYKFPDQNSAIVVYIGGDPDNWVSYDNFNGQPSPFHGTFDVVMNSEGHALVSNTGGGKQNGICSSVHKFQLVNGVLTCLASWVSDYEHPITHEVGYEQFRQVQVNANDEVFVGGITSSRIIRLDKDLVNVIGTYTTNIHSPWGVIIDRQGTMFVSNFGLENERAGGNTLDMKGPFSVAVIRDQDDYASAQLMTLPTGGNPVMLASGQPLYGNQKKDANGNQLESYEPLMRLTSSGIDGAGNLWAMNNWKPSFQIDVQENPGGDGVVIFVGVAEPA